MENGNVTERDNFIWLLFALVLLLFSAALSAQYEWEAFQRLINITTSATLLVAVWSVQQNRGWLSSRVGLSLFVLAIMIGDITLANRNLTLLQLSFYFLFLSATTYLAARQVLFTGNVDGNKIIGAICIYIMLGLVWAFGYLLTEEIYPGSLKGLEHQNWHQNLKDAIYFSFVTITTLGYGDISPVQPLSRFLAYMEAITGQFYIAILVASLIGIRLSSYTPPKE